MNERIKELVMQANIYVSEGALRGSSIEQLEDMKDSKLAELIINECADIATDAVANGELVGDSILEHFSVN